MKPKVYFNQHNAQFNYEKRNGDDIEYIRKDALLEWLNEMLINTANALDFRANCTYGKVIDKLNSM